jgi:hypothetical protein
MNCVNSTVATSAAPSGMPVWPELAALTASNERARMALAMDLSFSTSVFSFIVASPQANGFIGAAHSAFQAKLCEWSQLGFGQCALSSMGKKALLNAWWVKA